MRYLFKGLIRANGNVVEGHVESANPDDAINTLSLNGIVTESLRPNPKPLDLAAEMRAAPQVANALDSAFDSSSSQIPFDSLTDKYRGKNVWVIDRDKIRRRVAQVVDGAITDAFGGGAGMDPSETMVRSSVQAAISGMFVDNRNIASSMTPEQVEAAKRAANAPAAGGAAGTVPPAMEESLERLANLVKQAEMAVAQIQAAARGIRGGGGGGGGPTRRSIETGRSQMNEEKNEVLLEIFKSNMKLQRGVKDATPAPAETSE